MSTIELDPWGGDTNRSSNEAFQPRRFTTYDRDGNLSDDAMHRRYNRWHSRFDQPDPYGGSYDITNPQSFNRYSYVQNDPVNFVDPSGLCPEGTVAQPDARGEMQCVGVGVQSVDINISGGRLTGGVGGTSSGAIEIETSGNGPTEAEIIPQQSQQPLTPQQLLGDCRVTAMLDAIAWAEGTAGDADNGYGRVVRGTVISSPNNPALVGQTNVTITNFAQHPNILVQVNQTIRSTAAGRYQFLNGTWTGLNLPDFGRYNQDIGAIMLLQQVGAITPLLNGNVRQAAANSNGTWASLPNSPLGQPTRALAAFETAYTNSLVDCFIREFRGLP